jgi:gallate decarboxylase subunit C
MVAFTAFPELKQLILVDDHVDIYDGEETLQALTTRYQEDVSTVFIPGVHCRLPDPAQPPECDPCLRGESISRNTIFDCTVPFHMKKRRRTSPSMKWIGSGLSNNSERKKRRDW